MSEPITGEMLTINMVAERLRISRSTVYRLISVGQLAATTVSHRQRVSEADLLQYIDRNTRTARTVA